MGHGRKTERVLLVYPPLRVQRETAKQVFTPLGLAYLAASIRDLVEVEIFDAVAEDFGREELRSDGFLSVGASMQAFRSRIERFKPDMVGFNCLYSAAYPVIRELCRVTKKIDPEITTLVGGSFPSFLPETCMQDPDLDFVVIGEGEHTLRQLVLRSQDGHSLGGIDGLALREAGQVTVRPKTHWIEDLDTLPFPARDLLPLEKYHRFGIPFSYSPRSWNNAPMITTRGCGCRCVFCCSTRFWGNRLRLRSVDNVLGEIDELVNRYGIGEIQFQDDNLTMNRNHARSLFQGIIERGYRLHLNFPNGVALWTLDEEMVDLMARAGCYQMTLAIESGCQEVLHRIVKKPLDLEQALRVARIVRRRGIQTNAFYIIGFPGETREQIRQTFRFAERLGTDTAYFFVASPLPGTEMYETARDQGILREDFRFENQSFTRSAFHNGVFEPGELERLASRQFLRYNLLSLIRHPRSAGRMLFGDLLVHRPRYLMYLVAKVLRRVV